MPARTYQVTLGERVLRVQVRREADAAFVRVDDGEEQPVDWRELHGALHTLRRGPPQIEVLAAVSRDGAGAHGHRRAGVRRPRSSTRRARGWHPSLGRAAAGHARLRAQVADARAAGEGPVPAWATRFRPASRWWCCRR